ncbi:tetratricopeptide repeat protein [Exiguobacterium sp. s80]|uniref:tetratricopeptide repeat protein n=1 Tax=Exiguobacterium sp. s80 TaxID=2751209 RepID=UPI001BEC699C|nr:tetratricopeptide repeat protein [Exiguobacterium sp. s80]
MTHATLEQVTALRQSKQYEQAKQMMRELLETDRTNPYYHFQMAWCFDNLGEEQAAVPHYEFAIANGLDTRFLTDAFIGLGSTYRALGQYAAAHDTFTEGLARFPDSTGLKTFLALTLFNLKQHEEAMQQLLDVITTMTPDSDVHTYRQALRYYRDHLHDVSET